MFRQHINPLGLIEKIKCASSVPFVYGDTLLDKVKKQMHEEEKRKYPDPPYHYMTGVINENGEMLRYVYTHYNGQPLDTQKNKQIRSAAIKLRKLSILAGVIYGLDFSEQFLTKDRKIREALRGLLEGWLNRIASILDENTNTDELNQFVNDLVIDIANITKFQYANVIRQVRLAERYFVADYQSDILLNETVDQQGKSNTQLSISFKNNLTQAQRKDWVRIHSDNKPAWFTRLPDWEKEWFYKKVPTLFADKSGWDQFEQYFKSSAMSHIPGVSNLRRMYTIEDGKIISDSMQLGTLVPYEMPKQLQQNYTRKNFHQLINYLTDRARESKEKWWPNIKMKPLVIVQSVLSDTIAGDNELVDEQRKAINAEKGLYSDYEIVYGNDPVNFLRLFSAESGMFSRGLTNRWDHTRAILSYAYRFIQLADQQELDSEKVEKIRFIRMLKNELEWMYNNHHLTGLHRNFNAYKVALTELLVEAMGGQTSINCKSGKDRTGYAALYKQSILAYSKTFGVLPRYNDQGQSRSRFIDIFKRLFNSQRSQELAAWNTPGSLGLKDTAKMLCLDIAKSLGYDYSRSNQLANMNKPTVIKNDELDEAKEINQVELKEAALVVKHEHVGVGAKKLLDHPELLYKYSPQWEADEYYKPDKNELIKMKFSKRLPLSGKKASFVVTDYQISTVDNDEIVFAQMLKAFYAVNPRSKGILLKVHNQDVADKAAAVCVKFGVKYSVVMSGDEHAPGIASSKPLV